MKFEIRSLSAEMFYEVLNVNSTV